MSQHISFEFDESPDAQKGIAQTQLGKTVSVPFSPLGLQGGNWTTVIQTGESDVPVDWEVVLQPVVQTSGTLYMRITYTLGGTTFVKKARILAGLLAQRFHITGRRVQVDLLNAPLVSTGGPGSTAVVNGGCGLARVDSPRDWYQSQWLPLTIVNTGNVLDTGPGVLMAYQALLTTMTGDAQAYVGFYDTTGGAPAGGQSSLWDSPAFTAALQWASFADTDDARLIYTSGLVAYLSSTPGTYAASTTGGICNLQVKVGS